MMDEIEVGGVGLCREHGFRIVGFSETLPEPKVYAVDIPGGDGCIDVTEALMGDVAYCNRSMVFDLLADAAPREGYAAAVSRLANAVHGRRLEYRVSWEPGYTYTGRFSLSYPEHLRRHGTVRLTIDADPYKLREHRVVRAAAGGGASVVLECGRKRQLPTVTCGSEFEVVFGGETLRVQPGTWTVRGLWLAEGENEVFVLSDLTGGDLTLGDWADSALGSLADRRLCDLMWSETPADDEERAVYFAYDIKDL